MPTVDIPGSWFKRIEKECPGFPLDEAIVEIVRDRLFGPAGETSGLAYALFQLPFFLPMEITIKARVRGKLQYLWANSRFIELVNEWTGQKLTVDTIRGKSTLQVWTNEHRAKKLDAWDNRVIRTGKWFAHEDTIRQRGATPKPRLGIRFLIGSPTAEIAWVASVGFNLATTPAAARTIAKVITSLQKKNKF